MQGTHLQIARLTTGISTCNDSPILRCSGEATRRSWESIGRNALTSQDRAYRNQRKGDVTDHFFCAGYCRVLLQFWKAMMSKGALTVAERLPKIYTDNVRHSLIACISRPPSCQWHACNASCSWRCLHSDVLLSISKPCWLVSLL